MICMFSSFSPFTSNVVKRKQDCLTISELQELNFGVYTSPFVVSNCL